MSWIGMGRWGLGFGLAWVASCGGGGPGTGVVDPPSTQVGEILAVDTVPRVDLPGVVSVLLRVLAEDGAPMANLVATDFTLLEDGNPVSVLESQQRLLPKPEVFRSFSHLLLDRSGSILASSKGKQAELDAAIEYVNLVTTAPESFVAISWFDGSTQLHELTDYTNDKTALLAALAHLHDEPPLSASTNLYGAALSALQSLDQADFDAQAAGVDYRSLALVTFTDGRDTAGTTTLQTVLNQLGALSGGQPRYQAFTIGLGTEIDKQALASIGKDGSVFAADFDELVPKFQEVGQSIRDLANSFYLVSYVSPLSSSAGAHTLTVRATKGGTSAERSYPFSSQYFGPGGGFVDAVFDREPVGGQEWLVRDVAEDAQQRVYLAGAIQTGLVDSDAFVIRLRADGTLDTGFGVGGELRIAGFGASATVEATALAIGPGGEVVVAGTIGVPFASSGLVLWSLDANGGVAQTASFANLGLGSDVIWDLGFDSLGRLRGVGTANFFVAPPIFTQQTAVWAFTPALALDSSFGGGTGFALHAVNPSKPADTGVALAFDAQDRILAVGAQLAASSSGTDVKVVRFGANGVLDASFGVGGFASNFGTFQSSVYGQGDSIAVDSAGRVVVAGSYRTASSSQVTKPCVWRFGVDGAPDTSFAGSPSQPWFGTGLVTLPLSLLDNQGVHAFGLTGALTSLVLRDDDSILACGERQNGFLDTDVCVLRFDANGILHSSYNVTGFLIKDGAVGDNGAEWGTRVLVHGTGKIWVAGQASAGGDLHAVVWVDSEKSRVFKPFGDN